MTRGMNRLAIYCGSASPDDPRYIQLAYDVGKRLPRGRHGPIEIVQFQHLCTSRPELQGV